MPLPRTDCRHVLLTSIDKLPYLNAILIDVLIYVVVGPGWPCTMLPCFASILCCCAPARRSGQEYPLILLETRDGLEHAD